MKDHAGLIIISLALCGAAAIAGGIALSLHGKSSEGLFTVGSGAIGALAGGLRPKHDAEKTEAAE